MINIMLKKRNGIAVVLVVVLLICCVLTLIFGNGENKRTMLLLSITVPFVIYGFCRFLFWMMGKAASPRRIRFILYCTLFFGLAGTLYMAGWFVAEFPNGLYPSLGSAGAMSLAALDWEKRRREKELGTKLDHCPDGV